MQAFPPMLFMVLRFALVLTLALPLLRRPPPGQWLRLAAVAITMGGLHFTFMFWALGLSEDVTSMAITQNMYIPITVLLAIVFLKEAVGWRTLAATGCAFAGVLVVGFDPMVLGQLDALGLILLSAFFQALASVLMRGLYGIHPISFQGWTAVFSLPLLALASLLFESNQWATIQAAQPIHWMALAYTAVMASLVGHGLFFLLVTRHPLPLLMPYMLLMPLLAALFGIFIWGDQPGPRLLLGGGMILGSILFITLRGRRKAARVLDAKSAV
jgi:O-acetylserine/cysteine efflux transporter